MFRFTLRQLTFLKEIAQTGGIAPAARSLNVSAAAVSSAIDKLESVTGLTLFDRFPARGMRLTRAGAEFMAEAETLLARAEALDKRAGELAAGGSGTIHIGTHYAIAQKIILPTVLAFRQARPGVRIGVIEDDYASLVATLDSGEVDALVVFDQGFDVLRHHVEILMDVPPLVLLSSSHALASKQRVHLKDLVGIPYIAVSDAGPGPGYLQLLQAAGVYPEVPLTSQSRELVQAYVGKRLGFTLVGFSPGENRTIEGDKVVALPIAENIGHFRIVIARSRNIRRSDLVESFLDLCRTQSDPLLQV